MYLDEASSWIHNSYYVHKFASILCIIRYSWYLLLNAVLNIQVEWIFIHTYMLWQHLRFPNPFSNYRKVASSRLSWLVAHPCIFRLFLKVKFDAYVLWPLAQRVQNWIVDWSTARYFTVHTIHIMAIPVMEFSNQGYKIRKIFS